MNKLIIELEKNNFINIIRQDLIFDEDEYIELLRILNKIKLNLRSKPVIDKKLAAYLYEIPKMTLIWLNNFNNDPNYKDNPIINQLEDAWIELDTLIGEEILWAE
jgi:hypothetical protein